MNSLVRAKEFLKQGDLLSSIELFEKAIEESGYSDSEKVYILDSIYEISISLEIPNSLETLEKLSQGFFDVGQYRKSLFFCQETLKLSEKFKTFELQIENHYALGNVKELESSAISFLNTLIKKRETKKVFELIDSDLLNLPKSILWYFKTKCFVLMGDVSSIEKEIHNLETISSEDKAVVISLFEKNTLYWHSSHIIRNWILEILVSSLDKSSISKKYVIKLLSDLYYHSEDVDHELLENSIIVSKKWCLYGLGYTISLLVKNSDMENYFLSNLPNELISDQTFDLGKDFISASKELAEHEYVNKILFLESIGNKLEAIKLRNAFESKYPESTLLSEGKIKVEPKRNISKTLDEISRRGEKNKKKQNEIDELHVSFENIEKVELYNNYGEIISTLNMLKEFGKVIKLTDLLLEDIKEGDIFLDVVYLKVEALLQTERYFEARDLSENVILVNQLSQDKKYTFDYLLAESYFLLKEYEKARHIFLEIYKTNKTYRLTKNRLKVIEENK